MRVLKSHGLDFEHEWSPLADWDQNSKVGQQKLKKNVNGVRTDLGLVFLEWKNQEVGCKRRLK